MAIDTRVEEMFVARGLLPVASAAGALSALDRGIDHLAKFRGALLGGAVGDALGRPVEGMTASDIERAFGRVTDFEVDRDGNIDASVTDDTQMTMCVGESLIATGRLDPGDLTTRFVELLPKIRGIGASTLQALLAMRNGAPWWEATEDSAGNGPAMRVAPVGLVHVCRVGALVRDAALSSVVTHANGMAVASAIAQAFAVAFLAGTKRGDLDAGYLLSATCDVVEAALPTMPDDAHLLVARLSTIAERLDDPPEEVLADFGTGAYVLESLPAAWWCFLRDPEYPEAVLLTAVNAGGDADTVASMAGTLAGAYLGDHELPARWLTHLEHRAEVVDMADKLWRLVDPEV